MAASWVEAVLAGHDLPNGRGEDRTGSERLLPAAFHTGDRMAEGIALAGVAQSPVTKGIRVTATIPIQARRAKSVGLPVAGAFSQGLLSAGARRGVEAHTVL